MLEQPPKPPKPTPRKRARASPGSVDEEYVLRSEAGAGLISEPATGIRQAAAKHASRVGGKEVVDHELEPDSCRVEICAKLGQREQQAVLDRAPNICAFKFAQPTGHLDESIGLGNPCPAAEQLQAVVHLDVDEGEKWSGAGVGAEASVATGLSAPRQRQEGWEGTQVAGGWAAGIAPSCSSLGKCSLDYASGTSITLEEILRDSEIEDTDEDNVIKKATAADRQQEAVKTVEVLRPLVRLQAPPPRDFSLLRYAAWVLRDLCYSKDLQIMQTVLSTLVQLLYKQDEEVLFQTCTALSYVSDGLSRTERIQAIVDAGACERLTQLLCHRSHRVQAAALRTVGNIVTGNDSQTQRIVGAEGALSHLRAMLNHQEVLIRKEACRTISNITAGDEVQIQAVIDHNIVQPLLILLENSDMDMKKEAAWAISNATVRGTPEQIVDLLEEGCIRSMCDLLTSDDEIVSIALQGLENILKVGDREAKMMGASFNEIVNMSIQVGHLDERLGDLLTHKNEDICNKALHIIEAFFWVAEAEGEARACSWPLAALRST